jgi:hypothetical protein
LKSFCLKKDKGNFIKTGFIATDKQSFANFISNDGTAKQATRSSMRRAAPIFKDEKLQSLFDKRGFVKVSLLSAGQVDDLAMLFAQTETEHKTVSSMHHTTTDTQNADLIYRVDAKIKSLFLPELKKILLNFKPLVGCFHIKEPGSGSETGIHQDPTFVDESKYCSANVWMALHDIDKKNGNLFFVSGSNHAMPSLRVTPQSSSYYGNFYESLPGLSTQVQLKKGEAVIFNNETIHGATENLTNSPRLAATLLVCSEPADWLLYYHDKGSANDKIEEYHLDLPTFATMPKDGRPDQKAFKRYITSGFPQITKDDFLERIGKKLTEEKSYLQKLKTFFRKKSLV